MNNNQNQMLSVKNAIEQAVQVYEAVFRNTGCGDDFLAAVERHVAALFVSGQIDRDFRVIRTDYNLTINFTAHGNISCLTFLISNRSLPQALVKESLGLSPIALPTDVELSLEKLRLQTPIVEQPTSAADITCAYDYANKFID